MCGGAIISDIDRPVKSDRKMTSLDLWSQLNGATSGVAEDEFGWNSYSAKNDPSLPSLNFNLGNN